MSLAFAVALFSVALAAYGLALPGPFSALLVQVGAAGLGLALILWLAGRMGRARKAAAAPVVKHGLVIDGSNVMHWGAGEASLEPVRAVIDRATERGWTPGVIFDANAGYKLFDAYKDDADLARALDLPDDRVLVVPKGQPADPVILNAARSMGGWVVSNDRFRDWAEQFPEVDRPGFVIPGGLSKGRLRLDLPRVS